MIGVSGGGVMRGGGGVTEGGSGGVMREVVALRWLSCGGGGGEVTG